MQPQFAPARCDVLTPAGRCPNEAAPASLSCDYHIANPQPPATADYELDRRGLYTANSQRQCAHVRKTGRQCGRRAAAGSDYCWTHSPLDLRDELLEARDEARAWLISQLDKALVTLVDCMDSEDDRVRLNAATQLLDRAGVTSLTRTQLDAVVTHQAAVEPSLAVVDAQLESLLQRAALTVVAESRDVTSASQADTVQPSPPAPTSQEAPE